MRLAIAILMLCACRSEPKPKVAPGGSCSYDTECETNVCYAGTCQSKQVGAGCDRDKPWHCDAVLDCFKSKCRAPGKLGDECIFVADCESHLECYKGTCLDRPGIKLADEKAAADERKQFSDKLVQAGVPLPPPVAEKPAAVDPVVGSGTIRTATATGKQSAIATCKRDERLAGGGCKADMVLSSYPSGQSELDTIGARWNCTVVAGREVTAYALCSKLP